jgi:hypothetical protein
MDSRHPQAIGGSSLIVGSGVDAEAWRPLLALRAAADRELAALRDENARLRR